MIQVVQNLQNDVPLVAGKKTLLRVFVENTNPRFKVGDKGRSVSVTVSVKGVEGDDCNVNRSLQAEATPAGATEFLRILDLLRRRKMLNVSANIVLPEACTREGDFKITALANIAAGGLVLPEKNINNNEGFGDAEFKDLGTLRIGYLQVCGRRGQHTICPEPGVTEADSLLKKVFPLADGAVSYEPLEKPLIPLSDDDKKQREAWYRALFLAARGGVDTLMLWTPRLEDDGVRVASAFEESILKNAQRLGRVAAQGSEPNLLDLQLAARVAQSLGVKLRHCRSSLTLSEALGVDFKPILHVFDLRPQHIIGRWDESVSECGSSANRWIDLRAYKDLHTVKLARGLQPGRRLAADSSPPQAGQSSSGFYLLVSGTVREDGTGEIDPVYRQDVIQSGVSLPSNGDYCIVITDISGSAASHCFDASFEAGPEAPFFFLLPDVQLVDGIALVEGDVELDAVSASPGFPSMEIEAPQDFDLIDAETMTVSWSGSDPDGDTLRYTLLYSADLGDTYLPIVMDTTATSVTFNTAEIVGGEDVDFHLLATDGLNTIDRFVGPVEVVQRPDISVDSVIDLGLSVVGVPGQGVIPIASTGSGPLVIEALQNSNPFFDIVTPLPFQISAGTTREMVVDFIPTESGTTSGMVTLHTNSPNNSSVDVMLEVTPRDTQQPILVPAFDTEVIDFGNVPENQQRTDAFTFINLGEPDLTLDVNVDGSGFSLGSDGAFLIPEGRAQRALVVSPEDPVALEVVFDPPAQGEFAGRLLISSNDPDQPQLEVPLTGNGVEPETGPSVNFNGVVDAASFQTVVAPGGIASIFGVELAPEILAATSLPLPFELSGVRVRIDGWEAPLFFISGNQINCQVPTEVKVGNSVDVVVIRDGAESPSMDVQVRENAPAVFLNPATGEPIVTHADASLVTTSRPAGPGDVLIVFTTGFGDVSNPPPTGSPAGVPLSETNAVTTVTVGGVEARVLFSGLAPFFVGLGQLNIQLPDNLPAGNSLPLVVSVGGAQSVPVNLPVTGP